MAVEKLISSLYKFTNNFVKFSKSNYGVLHVHFYYITLKAEIHIYYSSKIKKSRKFTYPDLNLFLCNINNDMMIEYVTDNYYASKSYY